MVCFLSSDYHLAASWGTAWREMAAEVGRPVRKPAAALRERLEVHPGVVAVDLERGGEI